MNKLVLIQFAEWFMEQPYYLDGNGKYTNDSMEEGYMTLENIVDLFIELNKPEITKLNLSYINEQLQNYIEETDIESKRRIRESILDMQKY